MKNGNKATGEQHLTAIRTFAERWQTAAVADLRGVAAKAAELDAEIARVRRARAHDLTAEQAHDLRRLQKAIRRRGRLINGTLPPTADAMVALLGSRHAG